MRGTSPSHAASSLILGFPFTRINGRMSVANQAAASAARRIDGLLATGSSPELNARLRLFDQLVGDWDTVARGFPRWGRRTGPPVDQVLFDWMRGGRAIQDVFGGVNPISGCHVPAGNIPGFTTQAWTSVRISPPRRVVSRFVGRCVVPDLLPRKRHRTSRLEQRIFYRVRPDSFTWKAVEGGNRVAPCLRSGNWARNGGSTNQPGAERRNSPQRYLPLPPTEAENSRTEFRMVSRRSSSRRGVGRDPADRLTVSS